MASQDVLPLEYQAARRSPAAGRMSDAACVTLIVCGTALLLMPWVAFSISGLHGITQIWSDFHVFLTWFTLILGLAMIACGALQARRPR